MRVLRFAAMVFIIAASVFAVGIVGAVAADSVDLEPDEDLDGAGVDGDPYIITNASELQAMGGNLSAHYELGKDIDASETEAWNDGKGFEPIGDSDDSFEGSFDGNNHTIFDLYIDRDRDDVGLFGYFDGEKIERVGLENVNVTGNGQVGGIVGYNTGEVRKSYATGSVVGSGDRVGGLVGWNVGGTVSESSATGSVEGSDLIGGLVGHNFAATVSESFATGSVEGSDDVGGLVGYNTGEVNESYANGSVEGSNEVGGLVGDNRGKVTESFATGSVEGSDDVGGLVGLNLDMEGSRPGVVSKSYATGSVEGSEHVGGFVGNNDGPLSNSFASGTVNGSANVGGFVGANADEITTSFATGYVNPTGTDIGGLVGNSSGTVVDAYWDVNTTGQTDSAGTATGLTTDQMTGTAAFSNASGLSYVETWLIVKDDGYPTLDWETDRVNKGSGTETDPFIVADEIVLQNVAGNLTAAYQQDGDITLKATGDWNNGAGFEPIGDSDDGFEGSFDGNGNVISDLQINRSSEEQVGLFGRTSGAATIENVHLENATVRGESVVGGLVGLVDDGTIMNVSATADVEGSGSRVGGLVGSLGLFGVSGGDIAYSYATGDVDGGSTMGGLVGQNNGQILKTHATGDVDGRGGMGGLVGQNNGKVLKSHATGDVEGSGSRVGGLVGQNNGEISESYTTSDVEGSELLVGGLVGMNEGGYILKSYAMGEVNGDSFVGGLAGGFVGDNTGEISESYATGAVNGDSRVGGLVGIASGEILKSYATGEVNGDSDVGGLVGDSGFTSVIVEDSYWDMETTGQDTSAGDGEGLTTAQMTGANASAAGNMDGFDFDSTWYITPEYPSLERPFEGEGTAAEPYELETVFHLQEMRKDLAANYTLVADIDATETIQWNDGDGFEPIGKNDFPNDAEFVGTFSGNGHTISNLSIERSESEVGLFGKTDNGASLTNVKLVDVTIVGNSSDSNARVGGLVGWSDGGTVEDSSVTGHIANEGTGNNPRVGGLIGQNSDSIADSHTTGTVAGSGRVGGLIGNNNGDVSNSHTTSDVTASGALVGGLIGANGGEITESYAMGTVTATANVGGLIGSSEGGSITHSYASGTVDGHEDVGGLVGSSEDDISSSYAIGTVNGSDNVGGLVGVFDGGEVNNAYWDIESTNQLTSDGGEGLTTAQMTGANASAVGNMDGFDFENTWYITAEYPSLERPFEGEGTEAEPYELETVFDLQEMRKDLAATYTLTTDVDASETKDWNGAEGFEPIGTNSERFEGSLNGDGHTISNLAINRSEMTNVGLFGVTDGDSTVENVGLVDANIHGDTQVGGLVGFLGAGATVSESYVTGTVGGNEFVGGLVGYNFEGTVSESYATGGVEGTNNVGGLVGENFEAKVSVSYATGTVNGTNSVGGLVGNNNNDNDDSEVITSYATGEVDGTDSVGGLIGDNSGTVIDSYWDTETTNQTSSDGGSGLSTAQMTGLNATESENMAGLNFESNWTATDSYPLHQWSVDDLTLSVAAEEITEGETTNATVTLTTADEREVPATSTSTYNSSPTGVVSLDNVTGEIRADSDGSTTITATLIQLTDSASLSVLATPSSGGSGGGFGGSGPPAEQEEESEQDGNDTDDEVDADPEQEADDTDDAQEVDDTEQGADEPETEADQTDDESAVDDTEQGADEPETEADDIDDGIPGFGLLAAALALLIAAAFWRRQLQISYTLNRRNTTPV